MNTRAPMAQLIGRQNRLIKVPLSNDIPSTSDGLRLDYQDLMSDMSDLYHEAPSNTKTDLKNKTIGE